MANVSHAILAKSDQLNFDDFGGNTRVITITDVNVSMGDQPISIFYHDHNGKPWKPSKGMIRLICEAYGDESDNWIGKSIELHGDSTVKWAGKEIGGIRISALSDIDKAGLTAFITLSRGKRRKATIPLLVIEAPKPTVDDQAWLDLIKQDPKVLNQLDEGDYKEKIKGFLNNITE
jgi:hypothetical protein